MGYARDSAMTALILGFFASSWFGWAQERPPAAWRPRLIVGAAFSLAVAAGGGVLAAAIALRKRREYLAPWICLVVGVHFWPMAPVLDNPLLFVLGALLTVIAVAAVLVSRRTDLAPSAITGAAVGVTLLGVATWSAVAAIA